MGPGDWGRTLSAFNRVSEDYYGIVCYEVSLPSHLTLMPVYCIYPRCCTDSPRRGWMLRPDEGGGMKGEACCSTRQASAAVRAALALPADAAVPADS